MILFIIIIIFIITVITSMKKLQTTEINHSIKSNKIDFCMHCGNVIDNKTKLCRVCNKRSK